MAFIRTPTGVAPFRCILEGVCRDATGPRCARHADAPQCPLPPPPPPPPRPSGRRGSSTYHRRASAVLEWLLECAAALPHDAAVRCGCAGVLLGAPGFLVLRGHFPASSLPHITPRTLRTLCPRPPRWEVWSEVSRATALQGLSRGLDTERGQAWIGAHGSVHRGVPLRVRSGT